MFMTAKDYQITNTRVYGFRDGTFFVSFDANNIHHEFRGTREQILPQMTLRIIRILHV